MLGRARDAFWARGVSATSISDLSDATGLSVGSIYKAFESKAGLCHRTLDDYLDTGLAEVRDLIASADSPRAGISAWLDAMATMASLPSPQRGCFAVECATELAETDEVVRVRLGRHDRELVGLVEDTLRAAAAAGEFSGDARLGARLLCATVNGIAVEARKGITQADAAGVLHHALDRLG